MARLTAEERLILLADGLDDSAKVLAERAKEGKICASDIAQLRAMFKEAGGATTFADRPTVLGDSILESLADVDPDLLN